MKRFFASRGRLSTVFAQAGAQTVKPLIVRTGGGQQTESKPITEHRGHIGWRVWCACLAATATAVFGLAPAEAKPVTHTQKVADARQSLEDLADEVAIKMWNERREIMDRYSITMSYNRQFGRWLAAAYSIGMCEAYVKPRLMADWMGKLDGLSGVWGEGFIDVRRAIEASGEQLRGDGRKMAAEMSPSQSFCSVELEAVEQFIREI